MAEKIIKNIIVKGHSSEIYPIWENFENFPIFMKNIKLVRKISEKESHWIMRTPIRDLEWTAQITDKQENKRIAWKSISGDIKTSGQVTFNDLDNNETEITLHMQYIPPAGELGKAVAHLFAHPEQSVDQDLKQFKKYAEKASVTNAVIN